MANRLPGKCQRIDRDLNEVSAMQKGINTPEFAPLPIKRQRTAALQDAGALTRVLLLSARFWSAAVLCRFVLV